MSTIILSVALKAAAAVQTEKAPPLPEKEEVEYTITDKLAEKVLGTEVWIGNRQRFNIYIDGELVYIVQKRQIGADIVEKHNTIGDPVTAEFIFPEPPDQQPNGSNLVGNYSIVNKATQQSELHLRATATTNRTPGRVVVVYQIEDEDQSLEMTTTYTSQEHLPLAFEVIQRENGVVTRHTLKTRQK